MGLKRGGINGLEGLGGSIGGQCVVGNIGRRCVVGVGMEESQLVSEFTLQPYS